MGSILMEILYSNGDTVFIRIGASGGVVSKNIRVPHFHRHMRFVEIEEYSL